MKIRAVSELRADGFRMRFSIALVSASALALELAFMRLLSARFWHHVAYLVITVALLGFGASGTLLTLLRGRIARNRHAWMAGLASGFGLATAVSARVVVHLPIEIHFLAWDPRQSVGVLALELLVLVPFLFAGAFVGAALLDAPDRVGGHYAANLLGSGAGAGVAVALLHRVSAEQLVGLVSAAAIAAAFLLVRRTPRAGIVAPAAAALATLALMLALPLRPVYSAYKRISFETAAGAEVRHQATGPFGRLAVVAGPSIHEHPGLAWQYTGSIPPHVLLLTDGDAARAVYEVRTDEGWAFMDHMTAAVAYALADRPEVLLVGVGGGADVGLALHHGATRVTALELDRRVTEILRGPLADRGGAILDTPGVRVLHREARGYLSREGAPYDLVQVPPMSAFGAAGGGLFATQESYLLTVESFVQMLDRLRPGGVVAVTLWMQDPPRAGLRAFETLAEALRRQGAAPESRLAMIRSRTTVTVLARPDGFGAKEQDAIRRFCATRGFDLGYLPGMQPDETNRFHEIPFPGDFEVARALLGPGRSELLRTYPFSLFPATDDRPFFFHAFRWRRVGEFRRQLGGRFRAFLEPGHLMLLAAFVQAVLLASALVLLPMALRRRRTRGLATNANILGPGYFLMLGIGFMMLEMSLLGRLILYLADPIHAVSMVVACFLVFAGVGSRISSTWGVGDRVVIRWAGCAVAVLGVLYAVGLGRWLAWSQGAPMAVRILVAAATLAPLAMAMGHLFPAGLRALGRAAPDRVPWAWAVNGFASVLSAIGTPLLAMHAGYRWVGLAAAACYAIAAWLGGRVGGRRLRLGV